MKTRACVVLVLIALILMPQSASLGQSHCDDSQIVRTIAWKPDGSQMAAAYSDCRIEVLNSSTGYVESVLTGLSFRITALAWHLTGDQLIGSNLVGLFLWDTATGDLAADLHDDYGLPHDVMGITWSPAGDQLITFSGATNQHLQIWDAHTYEFISGQYHGATVGRVVWNADHSRFVAEGMGGFALYDPTMDICPA